MKYVTPGLKAYLLHADADQKDLIELLVSKYIDAYRNLPSGWRRTMSIHRIIDDAIAEKLQEDTSYKSRIVCTKGCSACCYRGVTITADEALLICKFCKERGFVIDEKYLNRQIDFSLEDWSLQSRNITRCHFLDSEKGECLIHEIRPAICRIHMALDSNDYCSGESEQVRTTFVMPEVEIAATASFNICETGTLPYQLIMTRKRLEENFLRDVF